MESDVKQVNTSAKWFHYAEMHFIVLLYGFTAILGKLTTISATELVVYRMGLASLALGGFLLVSKKGERIPLSDLWKIACIGMVVALHWILFFEAAKVSNVSVTLGAMATGTLFTAFLEPIVEKRRIQLLEVVMGLVIIVGLYIITRFALNYWLGILYAVISAFLAAVFTVMNRQFTHKYSSFSITFYEMLAGFCVILLYFAIGPESLSNPLEIPPLNFLWVGILAILCTAYAFVGTVRLLNHLSAFTFSLSINLEPVYGIILAFFIFGESERMNGGFYLGAIILIGTVFVYPLLKK